MIHARVSNLIKMQYGPTDLNEIEIEIETPVNVLIRAVLPTQSEINLWASFEYGSGRGRAARVGRC